MIEIIPSVLAKTKEELNELVQKMGLYSGVIHLDISDGVFVNSRTIGLEEFKNSFNNSMDVHLMVQNPESAISDWLGLSNLRSIIFHIEATDKAEEIINTVHNADKLVGVAINPETEIEALDSIVGSIDYVHFMTVHPGNYGGEFVESVLGKIEVLKNKYPEAKVSVDGSIHNEIAQLVVNAGAEIIILGSHIFSEGRNVDEAINELKENIN
ncbi:MAG: hypothetical protein AAB638_00080 [Patescibacteria group bacterium]